MTRDLSLFTPEHRLLLLFALVDLSPAQRAQAEALMAQVPDWRAFFETAARNHALPMVARHLRTFDADHFDSAEAEEVHQVVGQQAVHNLSTVAELRKYIETCLKPSDTPFVVFKGITLAHRYYPDLGLRPCRDIDIAVKPEHMERLVRLSLKAGYALHAPNGRGGAITREQDIKALLNYGRSAVLISPQGIAIDLQPGIDKFSGIFDSIDVFEEAQHVQLGGISIPMLPETLLFNYICHHHARHLWSRLHWISDLDALLSSPDFDLDAARDMAERFGQRGTVDATVDLHRLVSNPDLWNGSELEHGHAFLVLCIKNLSGDLALEKRMAVNLIGGEFMFPWQANPDLLQRARKKWLWTMLRPSYHQYQSLPLPTALQWVYYPSRLIQIGFDGMKRRFGSNA